VLNCQAQLKKHKTGKAILNTIIFRGVCVPSRGKNLKGKSKGKWHSINLKVSFVVTNLRRINE
jgi:hypothetical protein